MPVRMPTVSPSAGRRLEELIPRAENVATKRLFGQPAAFVNGNLFAGAFGEKLFVRLSEPDAVDALRRPGFLPFEPMPGRPMRGYAVLPPSVLRRTVQARGWVTKAWKYVSTLPPKSARRSASR